MAQHGGGTVQQRNISLFLAALAILGSQLSLGCGLARGGQGFDDGNDGLGQGRRATPEPGRRLAGRRTASLRAAGEQLEASSSFVGDLDADGFADLVLVARPFGADSASAYGFYGRAEWPEEIELRASDFVISEVDGGVTRTGDVNGDGYADFGLEARGWVGSCCRFDLVLGAAERRSGTQSSTTLETSIGGGPPGSGFEYARLSAAGDVNGDGRDDLFAKDGDEVALILGRSEPFRQTAVTAHIAAVLAVPRSEDGAPAFRVGPEPAGDLDGDGLMDVLIPGDEEEGTALYYGRTTGFDGGAAVPRDALLRGAFPRRLGDWDGDGRDDLVQVQRQPDYGARADEQRLSAFQHQLRITAAGPARFQGEVDLSTPWSGYPPSFAELSVGDLNGDARPELLLGAADQPNLVSTECAGAVYLVGGAGERPLADIALAATDAALLGRFQQQRCEQLGQGVSSGADVNADGIDDLLIVRGSELGGDGGALLIFGDEQL